MPRTGIHTLVTIALSLALGAAVGEVVVRMRHPQLTRAAILDRIASERYTWRRPDDTFHHVGDGIYALDFPSRAAPDRGKIAIVGDSFTMGYGVAVDERFGSLLQSDLRGRLDVGVLAASSYSPSIYCNIVKQALSTAAYDAVVVFVDQTDPADDLIYHHDLVTPDDPHLFDVARMSERQVEVDAAWDRIAHSLSGWSGLARRFVLVNLLDPPPTLLEALPDDSPQREYLRLSLSRGRLIHAFDTNPASAAVQAMERQLLSHLDEMVNRCRERGTAILFATVPWEYHVSRNPRFTGYHTGPFPLDNRLEMIVTEHYRGDPAVTVIPMTAAFRDQTDPSGLFLDRPRDEFHWNRAGHAVAARALRRPLEAIGQTSSSSPEAP